MVGQTLRHYGVLLATLYSLKLVPGGPCRNRTYDLRIKRLLQVSHPGHSRTNQAQVFRDLPKG